MGSEKHKSKFQPLDGFIKAAKDEDDKFKQELNNFMNENGDCELIEIDKELIKDCIDSGIKRKYLLKTMEMLKLRREQNDKKSNSEEE